MDTTSVAEKAIRARVGWGIDLYRSGAVGVHGDVYVVRGTGRNYTAFFIDGEPGCYGPDYREGCRDAGHACKHGSRGSDLRSQGLPEGSEDLPPILVRGRGTIGQGLVPCFGTCCLCGEWVLLLLQLKKSAC